MLSTLYDSIFVALLIITVLYQCCTYLQACFLYRVATHNNKWNVSKQYEPRAAALFKDYYCFILSQLFMSCFHHVCSP